MNVRVLGSVVLIGASVVLAACGSSGSSSARGSTTATDLSACTPAALKTHAANALTVATDQPAYPPYFVNNTPSNGQGFESAVAYAVAKTLGYPTTAVKWTTVPFDSSYTPGPKNFDFDINEISVTPDRLKAVDFSSPYYTAPQAVIVKKGSKYATVTDLAGLKDATLGVQIGTTSLQAVDSVIKPTNQVKVFNTSNDVVNALKDGLVDGIVTDLPTAFYITSAQLENTVIAGQFAAPGGDTWGLLLQKDSPLTTCVSAALNTLRSNGTLQSLTDKWMGTSAGAPKLN